MVLVEREVMRIPGKNPPSGQVRHMGPRVWGRREKHARGFLSWDCEKRQLALHPLCLCERGGGWVGQACCHRVGGTTTRSLEAVALSLHHVSAQLAAMHDQPGGLASKRNSGVAMRIF